MSKRKKLGELITDNKDLAIQNREKEKWADELILANKELAYQNAEKEKRAAELIIANKELAFQNQEKEKRAAELLIANKELAFQNEEKEKRAAELLIANKELAFQNQEKEKRAAELLIANKELAFQNEEKEKRAAELIIANKELAIQNVEKEKKAAKLIIANKELAIQNREKEKRADELILANKELAYQNEEKEKRAAELIIANKELAFQNEEKEKRAAELIDINRELNQLILERKQAEVALRESEKKLKEAQKIGRMGNWEFDVINHKIKWSEQVFQLYERDIELGSPTVEEEAKYYTKEQAKILRDYTQQALETGMEFKYDIEPILPSGKKVYLTATMRPVKDENGKIVSLFGTVQDITEHKQSKEKLKISLENLERSNKELEQFAYVASHDLQEPLRMVSSYTQLLEKRYKDKLDQDANEFIQYAVDGASRMQKLINDLLDYSRVSSRGKEFTKVDLSHVLGQVISNLKYLIKENTALITNDELPEVEVDETQILRVLQNLIQNALKFRNKSELPKIHISCKKKNDFYEFAIRDNGIGIDMQYHDRVFTIFQRLHSKEEYPGTGIGLSICKRIIERHGGNIWFESKVNEGTTFYFTLSSLSK